MTQTQPDRLDQLEAVIERIDRKLDAIASDIVSMKVSQAKAEGLIEGFNKRFDGLEVRLTSQDTRLWGFVVAFPLPSSGSCLSWLASRKPDPNSGILQPVI